MSRLQSVRIPVIPTVKAALSEVIGVTDKEWQSKHQNGLRLVHRQQIWPPYGIGGPGKVHMAFVPEMAFELAPSLAALDDDLILRKQGFLEFPGYTR
ncbi:hypothetical protein N7455_008067 [Penicillium solitum]|uniref:uncharacterized protein n=1 Tax=Penicillium solitum TaxID=60172 RepID=UPI0032C4A944|nr:hypothetical protein N7455_008067 [Penicillium solitum]